VCLSFALGRCASPSGSSCPASFRQVRWQIRWQHRQRTHTLTPAGPAIAGGIILAIMYPLRRRVVAHCRRDLVVACFGPPKVPYYSTPTATRRAFSRGKRGNGIRTLRK
jgi:hypothetical protein